MAWEPPGSWLANLVRGAGWETRERRFAPNYSAYMGVERPEDVERRHWMLPSGIEDSIGRVGMEQPEIRPFVRGFGSGGRTRTYDQAVNSRPLYH